MKKTTIFLFAFNFLYWLGFTYLTRGDQEWRWGISIAVSGGYAVMMTYMFVQLGKNKGLYLVAGQGEPLIKYLEDQGYVIKKKKDDITFFKKPGWSWNPFRNTTIKESAFYTLITASDSIIENVPEHLERGRQPYEG